MQIVIYRRSRPRSWCSVSSARSARPRRRDLLRDARPLKLVRRRTRTLRPIKIGVRWRIDRCFLADVFQSQVHCFYIRCVVTENGSTLWRSVQSTQISQITMTKDETGKKVAALVGTGAVGTVTAGMTGAVGAIGSLLGCTSTGIAAGSTMASMMSAAATTGVGGAIVATLQSAGTVFAAATGGSVLAASAAIAAPIAAAAGIYYWLWPESKKKEDEEKEEKNSAYIKLK